MSLSFLSSRHTSVRVCMIAVLFLHSFLSVFPVYAVPGIDYDLSVSKDLVSIDGTRHVYRIDYADISGAGATQVELADSYASGLVFSGVLTSTLPTGAQLISDVGSNTLLWKNFDVASGETGYVEVEFIGTTGTFLNNT